MSHLYIEFQDFEYIASAANLAKIIINVYVKVLDKDKKYLGSLEFGFYKDIKNDELKDAISDIISQSYPDWRFYESRITDISTGTLLKINL